MTHADREDRTLKILILDRDAKFVQRACDALKAAGHHVLVGSDRSRDVRLLLQKKPDVLIIPSVVVTRPDAEYMADFVHELPYRPAIILTMTMARFDLAHAAWRLGADEVVFKPLLNDSEIIDAVNQAMQKLAGASEQ